ncbi:hypothetical protein GQ54DRAFT_125700 [Martensiomyces pterosporus]|nr:hypothetical protein GQ54DRAFT_125700 [Martensiomyces pterosporus]
MSTAMGLSSDSVPHDPSKPRRKRRLGKQAFIDRGNQRLCPWRGTVFLMHRAGACGLIGWVSYQVRAMPHEGGRVRMGADGCGWVGRREPRKWYKRKASPRHGLASTLLAIFTLFSVPVFHGSSAFSTTSRQQPRCSVHHIIRCPSALHLLSPPSFVHLHLLLSPEGLSQPLMCTLHASLSYILIVPRLQQPCTLGLQEHPRRIRRVP